MSVADDSPVWVSDTCGMLYLHCGWPHTGTSTFQAAMWEHRHRLAAAGVVYPEHWRRGAGAHHRILDLFDPAKATAAAIKDFQDYLRAHRSHDVLLSSELLTDGLPPIERRGSLSSLILAARQVMPVTCLWTLRCMADVLVAVYHSRFRLDQPRPRALVLGHGHWSAVIGYSRWLSRFAGMREVGDILGRSVAYSRYDVQGNHYDELLRVVGLADPLRSEIVGGLKKGPRLNARVTQKAAVALLYLDEISARTGVEFPWGVVFKAWHDEELRFADDSPCALVDFEVQCAAHEEALKASREAGFDPYIDFFGETEIPRTAELPLDPDVLTDADLERLVALLPSSAERSSRDA